MVRPRFLPIAAAAAAAFIAGTAAAQPAPADEVAPFGEAPPEPPSAAAARENPPAPVDDPRPKARRPRSLAARSEQFRAEIDREMEAQRQAIEAESARIRNEVQDALGPEPEGTLRERMDAVDARIDEKQRLIVILIACFLAIAACVGVWMLFRRPKAIKHKPDLLREQALRIAEEFSAKRGKGRDLVSAGYVDAAEVAVTAEDRAVVIGPPGTGKTAFLVSQLLKWAEQKRSFVCLDIKPEIYGITRRHLEAAGYKLLTYNPTQATGQRYNPLADIEGPEGLGELAAALIAGEDEKNAVFYETARDLLDAIASHLRAAQGTASLVSVRSFISEADGSDDLIKKLRASPDENVRDIADALNLTASNNRLLGSVFALFRANLRFVRYPKIRDSLSGSEFSLEDLCGEQPVGLFLQFEEQHRETTAHLLAAMVAHVMRYLIIHHERPPVLMLLDEIGTAPVVPALVQKLNTIRSRQLPTWLYFQSLEQMQKYGEKPGEGPNVILGACDVQMVFRLNDNASAEWMSDRIGVVDRVVDSESFKFGELAQKSQTLVTEPIIWPHLLQQLAAGEVVCTYRGKTWRGKAAPYFELWSAFRGKRPDRSELRDAPYAAPAVSKAG
jgi:type IV secretion system protein VirD4